jgi:hypothetical protein
MSEKKMLLKSIPYPNPSNLTTMMETSETSLEEEFSVTRVPSDKKPLNNKKKENKSEKLKDNDSHI